MWRCGRGASGEQNGGAGISEGERGKEDNATEGAEGRGHGAGSKTEER